MWPHLVLNSAILAQAGMADVRRLNLFRTSLGIWTLINCGYVVELTENSRVFIKMVDVQDCKSFVKHTLPVIAPPRGRLDITGERAYIRQWYVSIHSPCHIHVHMPHLNNTSFDEPVVSYLDDIWNFSRIIVVNAIGHCVIVVVTCTTSYRFN